MNVNTLRWNPYILTKGEKSIDFLKNHFSDPQRKLLFVLGKGFDVRMNIALTHLMTNSPRTDVSCFLVQFDEGQTSHSHVYSKYVKENMAELNSLIPKNKIVTKNIKLWNGTGRNKKRIGDRQAASIIKDFDEIKDYTDIIIDISALPRGVYFSLIGKVLSLIDRYASEVIPNLFVVVSENASIDLNTIDEGIDDDIDYLHGFGGGIGLSSEVDKPIIWFPILGENKTLHLRKAFTHIAQSQISPYEICPVFPFPAKNLRRVDKLLIDYHALLFDEFGIERQNIMYVPEQNPFEAYVRLISAIRNYNDSLSPLNGCRAVISTFSSKLLSIGTLMAAYELKDEIGVGVLNVDSEGYKIDNEDKLINLKRESELFVSCLTGEPYLK